MERVKLTYEKNAGGGESVRITKDGEFTDEDIAKLVNTTREIGNDHEEESDEEGAIEREVDEQTDAEVAEDGTPAKSAMPAKPGVPAVKPGATKDLTPPAGRGVAAAKLPDGTQITQDGSIDKRTLRGTPEEPDQEQQAFLKRLEKTGKVGAAATPNKGTASQTR